MTKNIIIGFAVLSLVATSGHAATNSWIGSGSGKWENPIRWSLGVVPDISQEAQFITNANNRTVTIDSPTVSSTPTSMTISNLTLSGPVGTTNILFVNKIGTNTPFRVRNSVSISDGGVLRMTNSSIIAGQMLVGNGATLEFGLGTNSISVVVSNSLTLGGKLNIGDSGGFTSTTYPLFTYGGTLIDNGLTIGSTPSANFLYEIITTNAGVVNLVVSPGTNAPPLPVQVTSIVRQGNDINITWNASGASNTVQVSTGAGGSGSYSNNFTDLSTIIITTPTTNYVDVGGATNSPSRFYRIRSP